MKRTITHLNGLSWEDRLWSWRGVAVVEFWKLIPAKDLNLNLGDVFWRIWDHGWWIGSSTVLCQKHKRRMFCLKRINLVDWYWKGPMVIARPNEHMIQFCLHTHVPRQQNHESFSSGVSAMIYTWSKTRKRGTYCHYMVIYVGHLFKESTTWSKPQWWYLYVYINNPV